MIRHMRKEELSEVVDLWLKTSIHSHSFIAKEYWLKNKVAMKEMYLPQSETWVYELDGKIVGFYSLVDEVLAALFVLPQCHGQGIGSHLLSHVQKLRQRLQLTVYIENSRACEFYLQRGFSVISTQRDRDTDCNEYLMEYPS